MKFVEDLTRSKRPVPIPDQADFEKAQLALDVLGERVAFLEEAIVAREEHPRYDRVVRYSEMRMQEIATEGMKIPVDDVLAHAEVVGQYNERKRITKELTALRSFCVAEEKKLDGFRKRWQSLVEKFKKKDSVDG